MLHNGFRPSALIKLKLEINMSSEYFEKSAYCTSLPDCFRVTRYKTLDKRTPALGNEGAATYQYLLTSVSLGHLVFYNFS